ncbi:hypothetical protein PAHAL_9G430800 [Panicum hallii]|uniref:Uncharacterized protein n=1 Tax=Panicum hallii TaxID=206008 RepID=A0A2S3IPS6_9POAL|nr:hypothetical protein PAHAL_9G430800 [Panicum hallii]
MTMQTRRRHGSSGELDVFGATSYFAGLPDYCRRPSGPADRRLMIQFQADQVTDGTKMEDAQLVVGLHGDERHTQLGVAKPSAGDEPAKASSSSSSSRELQAIDLGVATGDRRLQGVRVVRGRGDGERWVVRCGAWDEEHHERVLDDAGSSGDPKDDEVGEGEDDGDKKPAGDWESDSSSDLFDLDIE